MKFLFVSAASPDHSSRARWRGHALASSIQRTSCHTASVIDEADFTGNALEVQNICAAADVIVLQMIPFHPVSPAIQRWKARDKTIIADIDPLAIGSVEGAAEGLSLVGGMLGSTLGAPGIDMGGLSPTEDLVRQARLADAVTLPYSRLLNDWRAITDAFVLPDYIDLDRCLNITPAVHDGIVVGWSSEPPQGNASQLGEILSALERVCRARTQVRVAVWGQESSLLDELSIRLEQKFRPAAFGQWEWPRQLAYIDIGLAPVFTPFEERLRRQEVLAYMAMKIPWLASQFPDDLDLRAYGWLVQNSAPAWERVLLDMVDHLQAYREEASGEPYLFGISQGLDENLDKVLSIYSSIWNKKCR